MTGSGYSPLDLCTLGYAVVSAVIVAARWPRDHGLALLAGHAVLVGVVLVMPRARRGGRAGQLLGDWYPLLLLTPLYTEIGIVNRAGGRVHDPLVQRWEEWLFSSQPALAWIRARPSAWLSWVLHLGYLTYYAMLAVAPLALWVRDRAAMRRVVTAVMIAFYACYVSFLLFPVTGPRHVFPAADNAATRTLAAQVTHWVLDAFAAWGTAFPSSHVAAAAVMTMAALREWPALGGALILPTTLLMLGTVYGQFHYVVDLLAGLAVAAVVIGGWLVTQAVPQGATSTRAQRSGTRSRST